LESIPYLGAEGLIDAGSLSGEALAYALSLAKNLRQVAGGLLGKLGERGVAFLKLIEAIVVSGLSTLATRPSTKRGLEPENRAERLTKLAKL